MIEGRPPFVARDGWVIAVSVHDRWALTARAQRQRARRLAHPDLGGSWEAFQAADRAWGRFLERERQWYSDVRLDPPFPLDVRRIEETREQRVIRETVEQAPGTTIRTIREQTGLSATTVRNALSALVQAHRLRAEGIANLFVRYWPV